MDPVGPLPAAVHHGVDLVLLEELAVPDADLAAQVQVGHGLHGVRPVQVLGYEYCTIIIQY